jgi:hypothetical protein
MLPKFSIGGEDPGPEEVDESGLADLLDTPSFTVELVELSLEHVQFSVTTIYTYQSSNLVDKAHLTFSGSLVITSSLCTLSSR